jgi:[protein-PII] uridylyltransferase
LSDVVNGKAPLQPLLQGRDKASRERPPKVAIDTKFGFDDNSSEHSTLLEIVAQDRPGLLYDIGSTLARLWCNIEVALIDTEGQKVIDVFYLTEQGKKLGAEKQAALFEALRLKLG